MAVLIAAAFSFGALGMSLMKIPSGAEENPKPIYRLEFADPEDLGKNTADSGIPSASIADGGGIDCSD